MTLLLLSACVGYDKPRIVTAILPEIPADIVRCVRDAAPEHIPPGKLTASKVERLWANDRVRVRVVSACGERFIRWYEDVRQSYGQRTAEGWGGGRTGPGPYAPGRTTII